MRHGPFGARHVIRSRCAVPLQPVDYESAVAALRVAILYLKTVYFTLARSERGEALSRDHVQRMPTPADAVRWGKTGEGRPTIIRKTGFMSSRLAMIDAPDNHRDNGDQLNDDAEGSLAKTIHQPAQGD